MGGEAEQKLPEDEGEESGIGQEGGRTSRERDAYAENGIAGGTPNDEILPAGSEGDALDVSCDGRVVGEEEDDVSATLGPRPTLPKKEGATSGWRRQIEDCHTDLANLFFIPKISQIAKRTKMQPQMTRSFFPQITRISQISENFEKDAAY